jgi:hypothetical protein
LGLLAACNSIPEAGRDAAAQESPGTVKAAMCAGASVSNLTVSGINTIQGEMAGAGDWAVTYPANAVRLDYYIDGVLQTSDMRRSDNRAGSWSFSQSGVACGTHTFEVKAYATVSYSGGDTICWNSGPGSLSRVVSEPCPCGNGVCDGDETRWSCPQDCNPCGNGVCDGDETRWSCPVDCDPCGGRSTCGDGTCCPDSGICPSGYHCPILDQP